MTNKLEMDYNSNIRSIMTSFTISTCLLDQRKFSPFVVELFISLQGRSTFRVNLSVSDTKRYKYSQVVRLFPLSRSDLMFDFDCT